MAVLVGVPSVAAAAPLIVATPFRNYRSSGCPFASKPSLSTMVYGRKNCLSFSTARVIRVNSLEYSRDSATEEEEEDEDDDEVTGVVTALRTIYNDIVIVDTVKSRVLLLDSTHNVHSIFYKEQKWTGSYWDEFASLPAIVPKGPIAIFGLGGGTTAHLILSTWPSLQLEGWEIDEILIDQARYHLGLSDLEKHTQAGGILNVHIGDVLDPSASISGGYAGIVVDLFSNGDVLPQLQEVETWLDLKDRLMPEGRIMVNCGGNAAAPNGTDGSLDPQISSSDDTWVENSTIEALSKAFPGQSLHNRTPLNLEAQLSWKRLPKENGANFLALTGSLPDLTAWADVVPHPLKENVMQWRPYEPIP